MGDVNADKGVPLEVVEVGVSRRELLFTPMHEDPSRSKPPATSVACFNQCHS